MGFPNPLDGLRKAKEGLEAAKRKAEELKREAEKKADEIKTKIAGTVQEIGDRVDEVGDKVETVARGVGDTVGNAGRDLVDRIVSGNLPGVEGNPDEIVGAVDVRGQVNDLNSNGDTANIKLTADASAGVNLRLGTLGLQATNGSEVKITQNGDGPNATYTLRYDKQNKGDVTAETGTNSLGKGKAKSAGSAPGKSGGAEGNISADVGVGTFDTVEMTFKSKEDAIRAGEIATRLQLADGLDDALDSSPALMIAGGALPIPGVKDYLNGGTPLANPLNPDGAPGKGLTNAVGVSQDDIRFLQGNVTAYEQSVSGTLGLGVDGKLPQIDARIPGLDAKMRLAASGRFEDETKLTRRVELPTADKEGTVTYSLEGNARLTGKEKASLSEKIGGNTPIGQAARNQTTVSGSINNKQNLGSVTTKISMSYSIPKGETPEDTFNGRPIPETSGNTPLTFKNATIENRIEVRDQALTDQSRTDTNYVSTKLTLTDPGRIPQAAGQLLEGRVEDAARTAGASVELTGRTIRRDGFDTQAQLGVDAVVAKAGISINMTRGVDDITERKITLAPGEEPQAPNVEPPRPEREPKPKPSFDPRTVAVVPFNGVNIRDQPGGRDIGNIQSGSFLRTDGEAKVDGGESWVPVSGTDEQDKPVKGWVRADLLADHSPETGAMDGTGRINPANERKGYAQITVAQRDNLWNLAKEHGWDYKATLAANRDHILNPALIFKGDTVYVPGTADRPAGQPER